MYKPRYILVGFLMVAIIALLPFVWSPSDSSGSSTVGASGQQPSAPAGLPPASLLASMPPFHSSPAPVRGVAANPSPAPAFMALVQPVSGAIPPPTSEAAVNANLANLANSKNNPVYNSSLEIKNSDGQPDGWLHGDQGVNDAKFTYPVSGYGGGSAAQVSITSYASGDAKWYFKNIPASGGQAYLFSDYYKSTTSTYITAQFTSASGATSYVDAAHLAPANTWTRAVGTFYIPAGTVSLTVFHLLNGVGTLTTDDDSLSPIQASYPHGIVSINFDDGWESAYTVGLPILQKAGLPATFYIITHALGGKSYMTAQQVLDLQSAGEEIGAHTRTHPDLTTLAPAQMKDEIAGSLADLKAMGINSVTTFAYPYGAFNDQADAIVRQAGFSAARTVEPALNYPEVDPYKLRAHTILNDTSVQQVQAWIDEAVKDRQWLILLFHEMDTNILAGDSYSWPSRNFQAVMDYLVKNNVSVMTNTDVIKNYPSR